MNWNCHRYVYALALTGCFAWATAAEPPADQASAGSIAVALYQGGGAAGKGVPHVRRNGRGDQLIMLSVEVPRTLTKEQRELLEKLGATLGTDAKPQEKSFVDSLKDLFGGTAG